MNKKKKKIQELKEETMKLGKKIRDFYNLPYRFPTYWDIKKLEEKFYSKFNEMLVLQRG